MIRHYLNSAFRNLIKNKKFTAINVAGFAFAISVCLGIVTFLIKEYSYDRCHENAARIYRLTNTKNNSSVIDYRVKGLLLENYSEIQNGCILQQMTHPVSVKVGDKGFHLDGGIMSVDNNFFEIFSIPFASGNSTKPFADINSAVITESTAKILFGTENPIGKDIMMMNMFAVTVTGVIKDFSENSSVGSGILVNAERKEFKFSFSCGDYRDVSSHRWPFEIYLLLNKQANADLLLAKINSNTGIMKPYLEQAGLMGLTDIYLHDTTQGSGTKRGNIGLLRLLSGIAIVILVLAIINYVNLTVAQQNKRNKDTGIKKTVGANRGNIIYQFITESLMVSFGAFFLGFALLLVLLSFYNQVFGTAINPFVLFQFPNIILLLGGILLVGFISGFGPAVVLSGISPVKVLSGSVITGKKKNFLQNSLTVFQFSISIVLIFCVVSVMRQIAYVKHKDTGFSKEQLLRLDVSPIQKNDIQKAMLLIEEFKKSPFIKNLSLSSGVPGKIYQWMATNIEGSEKNTSVPCILADTAFIKTFDIRLIRGRNLAPGDMGKVCMVNEAFYKHFGFENLENRRFNNYGGFDIIGVVKDFHYSSMHNAIEPLCILFPKGVNPSTVNVKIAGNSIGAAMEYIQKTWKEILPGYPIKYQFYDDWFDSMYKKEERFAQTIGLFAVLAIVISCIGILGLVIFSSERRTKEIGIRKVNGARISEVMVMLNRDFVKWVTIAFVIACPIAYYAMSKWLENFAYKTELSWWIFALAGLLALGIALLTVSWQSWKAATRNPVEALRYE